MVGDINLGGLVIAGVGAAILAIGLLGIALLGLGNILSYIGLPADLVSVCGWILIIGAAVVGFLYILSRIFGED